MKTAIAVVLIVFGLLYILPPMAARNLYRKRFFRKIGRSDCVCVTFDDGPDPMTTMRILDILAAAGAKATFFVTGRNAQKHPEIIARIIAEGHELGEHSFCHSHPGFTAPWRSVRDVLAGARILRSLANAKGRLLFRPPYGKLNLATLLVVLMCKKEMAFWTIDPRDYEQQRPEDIVNYVADRLSASSVILLHDGKRYAADAVEVTFSALKGILGAIRDKGLKTATVSEALHRSDAATP